MALSGMIALCVLASASLGQASGQGGGAEAALTPPRGEGPLVVWVRIDVHDLNEIDESAETFEFPGVMTSRWAFPPGCTGLALLMLAIALFGFA